MATFDDTLAIARDHWKYGRTAESEAVCHYLLNVDPDHEEVLALLGRIAHGQNRYGLAAVLAKRAITVAPSDPRHHMALGKAFMDMSIGVGQTMGEKAVEAFRAAIALDSDDSEALDWLGLAYTAAGRLESAVRAHRKALEIAPNKIQPNANLACVLMQLGRLDEAMRFHRRAIELVPDHIVASDNLLLCAHYMPGVTLERLLVLHREWQARVITPLNIPIPAHPQSRDPDKRLRIGFVSHDFGRHPVGYFLLPLLRNLDRERLDTICYSDRVIPDDMTVKLRAVSDTWVETATMTHRQLAQRVFDDGVDILFDLAGHTAKSRLLTFAYKPAPIQVTWAGYVGTTGLETMDYLLADRFHVKEGTEDLFSERILRLPDIYVCAHAPDNAPEVGALPAGTDGSITFASFSIPTKVNPGVIDTWARILARVPESRLLLMYKGMDDDGNRRRIEEGFARRGIAPNRLDLRGPVSHNELLLRYATRVDITLDTFPYSGGLTTCESLWMGVPVITCPGETFASRHSFAYLSVLGLQELVADSKDDYVERAVALAADRARLAAIRAGLRDRIRTSPLHDGRLFADNFAAVLRDAWRHWCIDHPAAAPLSTPA